MSTRSSNPAARRSGLSGGLLAALLALALGLLVGCGERAASASAGQGLVAQQAWWVDPTGKSALADVEQVVDWTPFSGLTKFGFGAEPIWFKLRIKPLAPDTARLSVLRVLPAYLDEVIFHDPLTGRVARAGRTTPVEGELVSSINFSFPVSAHTEARDIYVRVASVSTRLALIDVLPYVEATYRNRVQEWLFAILIALSGMSVLWATVEWLINREAVVGLFAIKQAIATIWAVLAAGFARVLIGPDLPGGALTNLQSTLMPFTIAASIAFVTMLLANYHPPRFWIRLLSGLVIGFACLPLLQFVDLSREIRIIANVGIPLVFVLFMLTLASVVRRRTEEPLSLSLLFAYLCAYCLMLTVPVIINLGGLDALLDDAPPAPGGISNLDAGAGAIASSDILAVYGSLASLMLDGLVMRILLMHRAYVQRRAQQVTELELQRSEEESKARRRLNEEQSRLFSMLAHEMKTPLATVRMWANAGPAGQAAIARAISDMNLVIERCVHTGQLAEQGLEPIQQVGDALAQTRMCIDKARDPARVMLSAPQGPAELVTDLQMLSIVLVNLLDNACKYSAPDSPIEVRLEEAQVDGRRGWAWRVSNLPGQAGMPEAGRLFEKYYRSPGARHQSGSGLGLFLVRGLLDLMGGNIRFDAEGERVVFRVWLPATPPER
jgi:signal transduction histidine kinase